MTNWQRWKGIMKCYPFEEKRLAKWEPPYVIQPKYDGVRCRAVPLDNGDFLLLSSEENPIFSVPHINEACRKQLSFNEYDGELYCHSLSFEEIVSRTSRTVNLHSDYESIQYHIFDFVKPISQAERIKTMGDWEMKQPLVKAPFWVANNLTDVMKIYDHLISLDYEGIIVRNIFAPYERKRSTSVMKFKPKKEDTYDICGYEEEISISGVPKGTLGSLVLLSGDGENTFKVGTGFDTEQRYLLWQSRESLCGKTCKIAYQNLSSGRKVPRFPIFVNILDKEIINE